MYIEATTWMSWLQPRSQCFSLLCGGGREKTLASAGDVTLYTPKCNASLNTLESRHFVP